MEVKPIVVGTDGSESAQLAVQKAGELAKALGTVVHVVSAYTPGAPGAWVAATAGVAVPDIDSDEQARGRAQTHVERGRHLLGDMGVDAQTHVCAGNPAEALMSIAENEAAQIVVVGNRGMSGARRVLGSVPNSVSHHARCGVLIVPTAG